MRAIIAGNGSGWIKLKQEQHLIGLPIFGPATNLYYEMPKHERYFELHHNIDHELDGLYDLVRKNKKEKFVTLDKIKGVRSELYPVDKMREKYGRYSSSSFVYILWYLVEHGYDSIDIVGVDYGPMAYLREQIVERTNLEYWIGYFRGKGITIRVDACPFLCRSWKMYGVEWLTRDREYIQQMKKVWLDNMLSLLPAGNNEKFMGFLKAYEGYNIMENSI